MRKQLKKLPVFLLALCILALQLTGALRVTAYDTGQESEEVASQEVNETDKEQDDDEETPDIIDASENGDPASDAGESEENESEEDEDSAEDESSVEDDSTEKDSAGDDPDGDNPEEDTEDTDSDEESDEDINLEETETETEEDTENENLISAIAEGDNTRTVYFDATLSKLSYVGDMGDLGLPRGNEIVSCHVWVDATQESENVPMTRVSESVDGNTWDDVWMAEIDEKYDMILFFSGTDLTIDPPRTFDLEIPEDIENPCFYADTGDDVVYGAIKDKRSGYWGEAYTDDTHTLRDAEKGKGTDVVDIAANGTFSREFQTYYARVTLYDYYTDYELNGNNRDGYTAGVNINSHRIYQPFRQFNQALSEYYRAAKAVSPLYWGNFQNYPGDIHFEKIDDTLDLYGYSSDETTDEYKKFFYENNSMWGRDGGELIGSNGENATQNLTAPFLQNGDLMLMTTQEGIWTKAPFFDEEFLKGENSKNTVLGEVYDNIAFPFIQKSMSGLTTVDGLNASGTVNYWYFNSKDNTSSNKNLILRQDKNTKQYYLESSAAVVYGTTPDKAKTDEGNFFPLNESTQTNDAGRLNYGFGQKMEIDFRVTKDGTVSTTAEGERVPIQFDFRGDDDVWVFIDGALVLDVGGGHGVVNGVIDFAKKTATVSSVKKSTGGGTDPNVQKDLNYIMNEAFYETDHTLTMYYMERGLWESNLYITFNFPDENQFSVEKEVNTDEVDEMFDGLFDGAEFTFNIKNQATHYQTYSGGDSGGFSINQGAIKDYGSVESGKLENAVGAVYSISDEDATVDGSGNFKLKDRETAVFVNQFRRGSYIYLEEDVDEDVFRTTWELYDSGNKVSSTAVPSGTQYTIGGNVLTEEDTKKNTVSDGRQEVYLTDGAIGVSGVANSGYTQTGLAMIDTGTGIDTTDQTLVFRSYEDPDSTIGLDVKVKEINTVRTGTITVKKDKTAESEALGNEEFSFTVRFTDVAGMNLEGETPKELAFNLKAGEEKEIAGIPAGTVYTISEAALEGYTLEGVNVVRGNDTGIKVGTTEVSEDKAVDVSEMNGITVTGVVTADDDTANPQKTLFTFENEKMTGSIDITKIDASGIEGVEFTLFQKTDGSVAKDVDGNELKGTTASDGTLSFSGIPAGTKDQPVTYYLRETKTTSGHTLLTEQIEVTLPYVYHAGDSVNGQTVTEDGVTWHVSYKIINDKVFSLPSVGHTGLGDVTFFGTMLLGVTTGALILLLMRNKRTASRAIAQQKAEPTRNGWMPKGISR